MKALDWLTARAKEPSTRNGAAAALIAGSQFAPYPYSWIMLSTAAALGGHNMIAIDKAATAASPPKAP